MGRVRRLVLPAVALLSVVAHLPAFRNGFAWDDPRHVVANESLHGLGRLGEVVTHPYLRDTDPRRSPYRPLTSASFAVSWAMGGGSPVPFHAFNILLDATVAALVLLLLSGLGAPWWAAGAGAAAFAVDPVHVEAVANVVGRGDALMAAGALTAAVLWIRRDLPAAVRVPGVLLGCLLAVGSKENGVVVPALLVLLDLVGPALAVGASHGPASAGGGRRRWPSWTRADQLLLAGAAAVVVAYLAARVAVLGMLTTVDVAPYIAVLPRGVRLTTAVANLAVIARLLLFPADLAVDYGPAVVLPASLGSARFLAGAGVVAGAILVAALAWREGSRWPALAVAWALLCIAPVANILVPTPIWIAERTLYLPSVALAVIVAGGAVAVAGRASVSLRRGAAALAVVLLALGGWRSWTRSGTWRSTDAVLDTLAREHPESFRSQWWIASRLLDAGRIDEALARYREAVALDANDAFITLDYARALLLANDAVQAEATLRPMPAGLDPRRSVYLARSLIMQHRKAEAARVVRDGLARFPEDPRLRGEASELDLAPAGLR